MPDELPVSIPIRLVRRGADILGGAINEEGNPVLTYRCDCAAVTDLVLVDANSTPNGVREVAYTCDGCLTSHWVTITIGQPPEGSDR